MKGNIKSKPNLGKSPFNLEKMLSTSTVSRILGSDLLEQVSEISMTSIIGAICDLMGNSWDADSSRVDFRYYPKSGSPDDYIAELEDNGTGMDDEGIEAFYRVGDSPKKGVKLTPKGRPISGDHGVATILLKYICSEYDLYTWRNGEGIHVHEKFEGNLDPEKKLTVEKYKVDDKKSSGTKIVMTKLSFGKDKLFSLEELTNEIAENLPVEEDDFDVYVNDDRVVAPSFERATKFKIDTTGKQMGHVTGYIYVLGRKAPRPGINVKVSGRRIGDPSKYLKDFSRPFLRNRIVGFIHANDLKRAVLFNKGGFREDHPGYVELYQTIANALKQVERFSREKSETSLADRAIYFKNDALKSIAAFLARSHVDGITEKTTFNFADLPVYMPGRYHTKKDVLLVNNNYPPIVPNSQTMGREYQQALLDTIVDVLTLSKIRKKTSIEKFLKYRAEISDCITQKRARHITKKQFFPAMIYSIHEICSHSGIPLGALRDMVSAGILKTEEDGSIVGDEYLKAKRIFDGMKPLYQVILENNTNKTGVDIYLGRIDKILKQSGKYAKPFIRNLSQNKHPYYFVESCCSEALWKLFKSKKSDQRRAGYNAKEMFRNFGNTKYTLTQLSDRMGGMGIEKIAEIIDYAKREKIEIQSRRIGRSVAFSYRGVVSALQHSRGIV